MALARGTTAGMGMDSTAGQATRIGPDGAIAQVTDTTLVMGIALPYTRMPATPLLLFTARPRFMAEGSTDKR